MGINIVLLRGEQGIDTRMESVVKYKLLTALKLEWAGNQDRYGAGLTESNVWEQVCDQKKADSSKSYKSKSNG